MVGVEEMVRGCFIYYCCFMLFYLFVLILRLSFVLIFGDVVVVVLDLFIVLVNLVLFKLMDSKVNSKLVRGKK